MTESLKRKIIETIRDNPNLSYRRIAERHGVGYYSVAYLAAQNGLRRRDRPAHNKGKSPNIDDSEKRNRQMAARMGVSLKQYLAMKDEVK